MVVPPFVLASSPNGRKAELAYDAFGRMVSQTESGATQNFIYDGQNIALVLDGSGNIIGAISMVQRSIKSWPRKGPPQTARSAR